MSLHAVAVPGAKTRPPPALCRALFEFHSTPLRANGQGKALPPMYVQKNGIPARFRCTYISTFGRGRRKFRMSTAQVPKQGLNLHRESALYVALAAQVAALKWNLHPLRLNLHHLRLNLHHRRASGHFSQLPSRCTYKKTASQRGFDVRTSAAVALMQLIINTLAQLTGMKSIPVSCANRLGFNYLSATNPYLA